MSAVAGGRGCPRDSWSRLITLRVRDDSAGGSSGAPYYAVPIHVSLLPSDSARPRLMFAGGVHNALRCRDQATHRKYYTAFEMTVGDVPASGTQIATLRREQVKQKGDTLFCGGHAFTRTGQLLVAGGENQDLHPGSVLGLDYAQIFDTERNTWIKTPEMRGMGEGIGDHPPTARRWYPTVTRMPDGKVMVSSGLEQFNPHYYNLSVEVYDERTPENPWTVLSSHGSAPGVIRPFQYTHVFVVPDPPTPLEELVMIGDPGGLRFYSVSLAANQRDPWSTPAHDFREPWLDGEAISSVLLPFDDPGSSSEQVSSKLLVVGGEDARDRSPNQVDFYDLVEQRWDDPLDVGLARMHASTVLLPDGNVLLVNGVQGNGGSEIDTTHAQLVEPNKRQVCFGSSWNDPRGSDPWPRGYHNVAALLPDGRVFVGGGGRSNNICPMLEERPDFRYYSPPYLFRKEPRPRFFGRVPLCVEFGELFDISYANEGYPIDQVALLGPGSMTHAIDMNQRYVRLKIVRADGQTARLRAPRDGYIAPPGPYYMFLLREFPGAHWANSRLPSVGKLIYVAKSCSQGQTRYER